MKETYPAASFSADNLFPTNPAVIIDQVEPVPKDFETMQRVSIHITSFGDLKFIPEIIVPLSNMQQMETLVPDIQSSSLHSGQLWYQPVESSRKKASAGSSCQKFLWRRKFRLCCVRGIIIVVFLISIPFLHESIVDNGITIKITYPAEEIRGDVA